MSDLISKKLIQDALIEKISRLNAEGERSIKTAREFIRFKRYVDGLTPSAEPNIVRCRDCKWHLNGHLCKQFSQYGSIETPSDFYCGFGERKSDG